MNLHFNDRFPVKGMLRLACLALCCFARTLFAEDTNSAPEVDAPVLLSSLQIRPLPANDSSSGAFIPAPDTTRPDLESSSTSATGSDAAGSSATPQGVSVAAADASVSPASDVGPASSSTTSGPTTTSAPATGDSSNAWKNSYVNLINLLVNRGVLTKKDSGSLINQAEQDAKKTASAVAPAGAAPGSLPGLISPAQSLDDDTMRVGYVPETVKKQMRDEIKQDVLDQARDEHWAAPDSTPEWVKRYHVAGDVRVRYEGDFFPSGNDASGYFHNLNAINTGSPFDVGTSSAAQNPPYLNVNQDRNRFRLRARVGADVDVGAGFSAGLRIATGADNSPVTQNQTLGGANGAQGGNFSKYALWLDRGFLRYQLGGTPERDFSVTVGRFDNPFFGSSMIWYEDIGFDGLVAKGRYQVADGVRPFVTAGAFPVFNTDLNFGTYQPSKFPSEDKWLYAVQGGTDWKISRDFNFKGAVAYYDFEQIQGIVSQPVDPLFQSDTEPTDDSRPSFAQNGNTYIALRNIVANPANNNGTINQWQYFGLATPFHDLALTGQLDYSGFDPFHLSLLGEFVKNLAFDRTAIENNGPPQIIGPVNNRSGGSVGTFVGGDTGYNIKLTVGQPVLQKLGDWNVNLTYRYVESDAVVDAFNDSDFGGPLAGTNLKGYIIGGNVALSPRVWANLRFMSANQIVGPTYESDLVQFDINAKF